MPPAPTTTTGPARKAGGGDRKEARRQQILAGALEVFADKGYHDTGIADIAGRLGIGHGTFYRYFKNKADIFETLLDESIERIRLLVESEPAAAPASLEEYRAQCLRIGDKIAELFLANQPLAKLILREAVGLSDDVDARIDRAMDACAGFTCAYVRHGIEHGYLNPALDPEIAARSINAILFDVLRLMLRDPAAVDYEAWKATVSTLIIDGMRARG